MILSLGNGSSTARRLSSPYCFWCTWCFDAFHCNYCLWLSSTVDLSYGTDYVDDCGTADDRLSVVFLWVQKQLLQIGFVVYSNRFRCVLIRCEGHYRIQPENESLGLISLCTSRCCALSTLMAVPLTPSRFCSFGEPTLTISGLTGMPAGKVPVGSQIFGPFSCLGQGLYTI